MKGWIADCGARAYAGCLFEWRAGIHPEVDEPTPHEQGLVAARCLETVHWGDRLIPVAPLALQLSVKQRSLLFLNPGRFSASASPRQNGDLNSLHNLVLLN
jgi:hypothetical protein